MNEKMPRIPDLSISPMVAEAVAQNADCAQIISETTRISMDHITTICKYQKFIGADTMDYAKKIEQMVDEDQREYLKYQDQIYQQVIAQSGIIGYTALLLLQQKAASHDHNDFTFITNLFDRMLGPRV